MSTTIKPKVSKRNPYWIDEHRYYELKHFCLQYPLWQKELSYLDGYSHRMVLMKVNNDTAKDPISELVEKRLEYSRWCTLVEHTTKEAAEELADYLLKGVTEGLSYDILRVQTCIPCCRDTYYGLYRRFFWLLSKERH
jgi:hypothetical protein